MCIPKIIASASAQQKNVPDLMMTSVSISVHLG